MADSRPGLHTFADLVQAQEIRKALPAAPEAIGWTEAGPTNIGGRMTSLAVHPDQPNVLWGGAAGGGVWKSDDAGYTWKSLWHDQESLVVGSLAIDPKNPERIYCGTGEANLAGDSYPGAGIYLSTDSGKHWSLLASPSGQEIPTRIGTIAVNPFNPLHIVIGGVDSFSDDAVSSAGGMYVSLDSGKRWLRETFVSNGPYRCHSVLFHPQEEGTIFATFTEGGGAHSGIWRLRAGEPKWTHLTKDLPAPESFGRMSLAIATSKPEVIYGLAADLSGEVLGIFRSDNGGDHWKNIGAGLDDIGKIDYANTIAVHPTDPGFLICGGVDLYLTRDGGGSWTRATRSGRQRGHPWYAHADHHALAIVALNPEGVRIYDLNDGGMDVSESGGQTWENRSRGLAVTQYNTLDVAPSDGGHLGGGTQDNGTLLTLTGKSDDHFEALSGDGGGIAFDPADSDHLFVSAQNLDIVRLRDGREVRAVDKPELKKEDVFLTLLTLSPNDANIAFTASTVVFRTTDDGNIWNSVSPELDTTLISAIEVARENPQRIYVGTQGGGFFRSDNGGKSWSPDLAAPAGLVPKKPITAIESSPDDAELVLIALAGFGSHHLFHSPDGGRSWRDLDGGRLPDAPINALVIPETAPGTVYAAGDSGVFKSDVTGTTWENLTGNLPNVLVTALVYHKTSLTLFAATYGRVSGDSRSNQQNELSPGNGGLAGGHPYPI